jgi:hypothetical protein
MVGVQRSQNISWTAILLPLQISVNPVLHQLGA